MKLIPKLIYTVCFLGMTIVVAAQVSEGGVPFSFTKSFQAAFPDALPVATLPALDWKRIQAEDERNPGQRFAAPIRVDFSLEQGGVWTELSNGDRLWRLQLRSPGALAMAFLYDDLHLPPGAKLFMYNPDGAQLLGAYTSRNNPSTGRFWTGLIRGDVAVVEYYEPAAVKGEGRLHLFRVDHAYDADQLQAADAHLKSNFGFGTSVDCHLNANCPEGDNLPDQKRGVCRIIVVVAEGMGYCSGALMNNTDNDGTPYLLSAYHCQDGYTPLWDMYRFDFNYRGPGCDNPLDEPLFDSVLGSTLRAGRQENDFILLELLSPVPAAFDAFLNGWNRGMDAPQQAFTLHHPRGDLQKLSLDTLNITIFPAPINWNNDVTTPASHHFRLFYDKGNLQVGSSGGPLFDQDGYTIGQLHGGNDLCDQKLAYFGRLALAWEGGGTADTRLRDWLDPGNTGVMTLTGIDNPGNANATISGTILTEPGVAVMGVTVTLAGPVTTSVTTDASGAFSFDGLLPGAGYTLHFEKPEDNEQNGVSTLDIIRIRKHILGIEDLSSVFKVLAADVNASETVSTLDIIKMQKVILGIDDYFESVPSWKFFEATYPNPGNPYQNDLNNTITLPDFANDLVIDLIGVKSGDVNDSADPGN